MTSAILTPEVPSPEVQLGPEDILAPTGLSLNIDGFEMRIFDVPVPEQYEQRRPEAIATSNPSGFERILDKGISGLEDGEVVSYSPMSKVGDKYSPKHRCTLTRTGDAFQMDYDDKVDPDTAVYENDPKEKVGDIKSEGLLKKVVGLQSQEILIATAERGIKLADRPDRLGEVAQRIGFVSDDVSAEIPLPSAIVSNIEQLKSEGINVPNVKFFTEGSIDGEDYVQVWAEGEFPASEHPGYFAHDLLSEHYRPLVVFREGVMGIATLYARAVQELPEISAELPKDNYQINAERPIMVGVAMSDREKIDHAALCLDQFTTELSWMSDKIDISESDEGMDRFFTETPNNGWRYMPQMVRTILSSSHRQELLDYFDSVGSEAFNPETDEFSFEIYTRELFKRTQEFWGIHPEPKVKDTPKELVYEGGIF